MKSGQIFAKTVDPKPPGSPAHMCVTDYYCRLFPKNVPARGKKENTNYQKENKDFPLKSSLSHANGKSSGK